MDLKYFKNIGEDTYEVLIHGEIGKDVIGSEIAAEILMLNRMGAKVIKERINTVGGTVVDAFSIVSANIASQAEIHTINEGVADSSGSWILASGNKRSGMDFSSVFLHNPTYENKSIDEMPDGPIKDQMVTMRNSIVTILTNNTGRKKSEVQELLNNNTRLSAKESKDFGIIHEIIKSKNPPKVFENMTSIEIMNICKPEQEINLKIDNKMKTVLNVLNLSEDASEASAVSAVNAITNKVEIAEGKVENLNTEITGLKKQVSEKDTTISEKDAKIVELEAVVNTSKVAAIKNVVDSAITSGKFVEENRDSLTKQATTLGIEDFNEMVEMVKLPQANVVNQIDNNSGAGGKKLTGDAKLAEEYQNLAENDPMKLGEIKNLESARFDKMFNAWNK